MQICVYCASSSKVAPLYFDATERLALEFVKSDVKVVYGGGAVGLMGKLADTVLANGGSVKGVIPKFMHEIEWTHSTLTELEIVETMSERKMRFLDDVDALVALPGGTGTMEELLEAITLKRLGKFTKPILILNTGGFYDPLIEMFKRCVDENFMNAKHLEIWKVVNEPEEVLPAIAVSPKWSKDAIKFAAV
ncbi:MAG: TIGR00730 family Rossman fold protein [Thermoguttaceae bacterium]